MYKHPIEYSIKDLESILNIPVQVKLGPINSEKIDKIIEGRITDFSLAVGNTPKLPADIYFETAKGEKIKFNIFEVKGILRL